MKVILLKFLACIFILFSFNCISQKKSNLPFLFAKLKYDQLICYECDHTKEGFIVMNDADVVNPKIIKNSKEMTKAQTDSLYSKFINKLDNTNRGPSGKECYFQDVAFVYYFEHKIVASFNISRFCNIFYVYIDMPEKKGAASLIALSFKETNRKELKIICNELGLNCGK